MVVAQLREAIRKRSDDGKVLVVISADVLTAFDQIKHDALHQALEGCGVDIDTRIEMAKQLYHKHASLIIPGAGETEAFPFARGGWQGGINTPDAFNRIIQHFLRDSVELWNLLGLGMSTDDGNTLVNHIFFADNGYFLADSFDDCLKIFEDVTPCLYAIGFQWKPSSLQIMMVGSASDKAVSIGLPDGSSLPLLQVSQMEVLGPLVCNDGGYRQALDHRLGKGERVFRKYQKLMCSRGSNRETLFAWESTAMTSALHCSGTLPLTQDLARHAHSWEMRMLRQAFRMRPSEDETLDKQGWERYYDRSR